MATLKEIYAQLDVLIEELNDIVDNTENSNKASDIQKDVLDRLEYAASELDTIIADEIDGLYEDDDENGFLGEDEERW
jgi:hypothetical protein